MRISSANAFTNTIANLGTLQSSLATQENQLSSGLAVTHAGDNPLQAANAERAIDRLIQLKAQQTSLTAQQASISTAGSALGSTNTLLQSFRDLVVQAGNASNNSSDRASLVQQMQSIANQVLAQANTQNSNGTYLFSGLQAATDSSGAATAPFVATGTSSAVLFTATAGQNSPTQNAIPFTMDGNAIFMQVPPATNGVFGVSVGAGNTAQLSTDTGSISPATSTLSDTYQVQFTVGTNSSTPTTYQVYDTATSPPTSVAGPTVYDPTQQPIAVQFQATVPVTALNPSGIATVSLNVTGTPANNDTVEVSPQQMTLGGQNTGLLATNTAPSDFTVSPTGTALSAPFQISFSGTAGGQTYTVTNSQTGAAVAGGTGTYTYPGTVQFTDPGTGATVSFNLPANPGAGDTVQVQSAAATNSIFSVMQAAINGLSNQATGSGSLGQTVATALRQIDNCLNNVSTAQSQTGLWINQATSISTNQTAQSTQLTADQANAQDVDMVSGLSQFQSTQQAYQVALQSYSSIQKLSLFNYIS